MRALQKTADDFEIFGAVDLPSDKTINIDAAVDAIFKAKNWPLLGGPSGRGWSYFSTAGRCAQLFKKTYDVPLEQIAARVHGQPLQIGALFHTLEALFYGGGLGDAIILPDRKGLLSGELKLKGRRSRWTVPATAADELLEALKALCASDLPSPSLPIVEEAERLFDAHANWWSDREDVTPLGVEVFAEEPRLGYTCRYDLIGRVGDNDPTLPPGVYIFEKKSTKWIDEMYLEGWQMDGEVLGQILCWEPSGMADLFGPLAGVVLDAVSKGRVPECRRVVLPPTLPAVGRHRRWVQWTGAQIQQWRAIGVYPQMFGNCYTRYGRCEEWANCVTGLTDE